MEYTIFADGACAPNPGVGGYGALMIDGTSERFFIGGKRLSTNNEMEFSAVIAAIQQTPPGSRVVVFSDSQLVVKVANGQYRAKKTKPLARRLAETLLNRTVSFHWVRGHDGNEGNEIADRLSKIAASYSQKTDDLPWGPVEIDPVRASRLLDAFLVLDAFLGEKGGCE
jgi:ribonuclease HI